MSENASRSEESRRRLDSTTGGGPPTVSVIVLNYNGLRHLAACFDSLAQVDYPRERLEVMLVDNASTDGSLPYMESEHPDVRVVRSRENVGFAAGNNLGARNADGDYLIFLNNDMAVERDFLRELVAAVRSGPNVVSAGAKILNWDGTRFDFAGAEANFAGHAGQVAFDEPYDPERFTEITPVLFACGGAMIVDRRVFLDLGGFDEDYFIYYEDVDLGWRLWLHGYEVVFAPDAVVYHRHHGTMSAFADHRKAMLYKRNALYSMLKNYGDENLGRVLPAALLTLGADVVEKAIASGEVDPEAYSLQNGNTLDRSPVRFDKSNVSMLMALREVVENLPQLMEKRGRVQERRVRSDEEIAHLFRPYFPPTHWSRPEAAYATTQAFGVQDLFAGAPRRVLLVSPDLLPLPGLPTVGSGLRAWGLGQSLKAAGHDVVFSVPRGALDHLGATVTPDLARLAWQPFRMHEVVDAVHPDVVLICGWALMGHFAQHPMFRVPVVLDQHGPHMLERAYQNFETSESNAQVKLEALRRADYFTCAGSRQLAYFDPWLVLAGWSDEERRDRAAAIPVSLSPEMPERDPHADLTFVYGGVFLPWQDPSVGLLTLVDELERRGAGRLKLFGGRHPWIPIDTGVFDELVARLERSSHVTSSGTVTHDELIETYRRSHVAIDVMKRNPERELAFTTRTVEYLWCGLPVIYNDYAELADYIRDYDAGWTVDPEDPDALREVLAEIYERPERVEEKSRNARRLVRERLTWDRTGDRVDGFVRRPSFRPRSQLNGQLAPSHPAAPIAPRLWEKVKHQYNVGGVPLVARKTVGVVRRGLAG